MKFFSLELLALATVLAISAEACKCNVDHVNHNARTQLCCESLGGVYKSGDCAANSIANQLSGFSKCCHAGGFVSDCKCPSGCSGADIEEGEEAEKREMEEPEKMMREFEA